MTTTRKHKKNLIVSYKKLTDDLKEAFKEVYPEGWNNYITKFVKPTGEAIYVVPFETEDTNYMVKFDVQIDNFGVDLDKDLFDDDLDDGKESEFAPISEAMDKEENATSHNERHLRHGDFEDLMDEDKKEKAALDVDKDGLKAAFDSADEEEDEIDNYDDVSMGEGEMDEDFEPSDDDLRGIEAGLLDVDMTALEELPSTDRPAPQKPAKKATKTKTSTTKKKSK